MFEPTFVTLWHPRSGVRCLVKFTPGEPQPDGGCNVRVDYSFRRALGLGRDLPQLSAAVEAWAQRLLRGEPELPAGWRLR